MISNARFHCRGNTQCLMHAGELVVHEMERDGCFMIRQFFAEGIQLYDYPLGGFFDAQTYSSLRLNFRGRPLWQSDFTTPHCPDLSRRNSLRDRVQVTMRVNIKQFLSQTLAGRRHRFARQMLTLEDRIDELLADHARMVHAKDSRAKQIRNALCEHFTQRDTVAWQQREEDKAFRTLNHGL